MEPMLNADISLSSHFDLDRKGERTMNSRRTDELPLSQTATQLLAECRMVLPGVRRSQSNLSTAISN
jgi:hypothetical protein